MPVWQKPIRGGFPGPPPVGLYFRLKSRSPLNDFADDSSPTAGRYELESLVAASPIPLAAQPCLGAGASGRLLPGCNRRRGLTVVVPARLIGLAVWLQIGLAFASVIPRVGVVIHRLASP